MLLFSAQTLTTVGFGRWRQSSAANLLAAFEAMVGLLGFAVATGVMFGRVSRPSARIGFSERAMMAPYQEGLQFSVPHGEPARQLADRAGGDAHADDGGPRDGSARREFKLLRLERDKIMLFPLTWTVVHPIDRESPLAGKSAADLEELQAEFMVLVKAWDETFSQTVHQRFSYRYNELVWGGRFAPAFNIGESGDLRLDVDKVGAHLGPGALSDHSAS